MTPVLRSVRATLYRLAALFAVVGQLVLTVAAGAEGWRGPSTASHVESRGIDQHYAHNEATCVTCTVLSLHACGTPAYLLPIVVVVVPSKSVTPPPTLPPPQNDARAHPPRAPPQLG